MRTSIRLSIALHAVSLLIILFIWWAGLGFRFDLHYIILLLQFSIAILIAKDFRFIKRSRITYFILFLFVVATSYCAYMIAIRMALTLY
jgi:hypothetical protein